VIASPKKVFEFDDPAVRIDFSVWSPDGRWALFDRFMETSGCWRAFEFHSGAVHQAWGIFRRPENWYSGHGAIMMMASRTLTGLVRQMRRTQSIRKSDLVFGDCLIVKTLNSSYRIVSLGNEMFRVSGGWFDRAGVSPVTTRINGCTWGGSAIHTDLAAGRGLFLEFGNQVLTTRIRQFRVIRSEETRSIH